MRRATLLLAGALFLASAGPQVLSGQDPPDLLGTIDIQIQVSPHTLNLDWRTQGDPEVTVHVDELPYHLFQDGYLYIQLGDVQAVSIFPDARGDLVAKFPFNLVIEGLVTGPETLTLEACDLLGNCYTGSDEVRIIAP